MPIFLFTRNQGFSQINTTLPLQGGGDLTGSAMTLSVALTGTAGSYNTVTVNSRGQVTSGSNVPQSVAGVYVTASFVVLTSGSIQGGGPLSGSTMTLSLAPTGSAGIYTNVTVNDKGQVTAGSSRTDVTASFIVTTLSPIGGGGPLTGSGITLSYLKNDVTASFVILTSGSIAGGGPLTGSTLTLVLVPTGTAGSYNTVTVNDKGQVTSGSNVSAPGGVPTSFVILTSGSIQGGGPLTGTTMTLSLGLTGTAGSYTNVTVNDKGQVTAGTNRSDVSASFVIQTSGSIVGGGPLTGSVLLVKLTGTIDQQNTDIQNLRAPTYFREFDNGVTGAAKTIDWTVGLRQRVVVSSNCTASFTAPAGPANLLLKLGQNGAFPIAWPATVKWNDGIIPTTATTSGTIHIVTFYYDGTNYFGMYGLSFS